MVSIHFLFARGGFKYPWVHGEGMYTRVEMNNTLKYIFVALFHIFYFVFLSSAVIGVDWFFQLGAPSRILPLPNDLLNRGQKIQYFFLRLLRP
jgi:hypothetical protein